MKCQFTIRDYKSSLQHKQESLTAPEYTLGHLVCRVAPTGAVLSQVIGNGQALMFPSSQDFGEKALFTSRLGQRRFCGGDKIEHQHDYEDKAEYDI